VSVLNIMLLLFIVAYSL